MALQNTIYMPVYRGSLGEGNMKKVQQGVAASIQTVEQANLLGNAGIVRGFVHEGDVFIPHGIADNAYKYCRYSKELGKFERALDCPGQFYPLGEYVAYASYGSQRRGSSPFGPMPDMGALGITSDDYAVLFDTLWILSPGSNLAFKWPYPFSGAPTQISTLGHCIAEHNGELYVVYIVDNGTHYLRKWNPAGPSWLTLGSGFTLPRDNDKLSSPASNRMRLFSFGGKLYLFVGIHWLGSQLVGCYELDTVNGDIETDLNGYIPAEWKITSSYISYVDFVRDASGTMEQMFLLRTYGDASPGGWEIYEFLPSSNWTLVCTGSEGIWPVTTVLYHEQSKGARIKSAVDTTPSNYATLGLTTADRYSNGGVNVDPRYRDLSSDPSQPAPFNQCTEKNGVGSEGKTGLSSKPAGITVLSDLSDDFSDDLLDPDLWEPVCPGLGSTPRDCGTYKDYIPDYTWAETGGELRFGSSADSYVAGVGVGVKSKWFMNGVFQADFTVSKIANLVDSINCRLYVIIKTTTNRGYGFCIYKSASVLRVFGLYMAPDTDIVFTVQSAFIPVDGSVIRITRNASNIWAITVDPTGSPEDKTPAGDAYSEDAQIWMFCCTHTTAMWSSSVDGPGIEEVVVSGAGSLGRYDGAVGHNFMWDHITDLGAGVGANIQTFIDVN